MKAQVVRSAVERRRAAKPAPVDVSALLAAAATGDAEAALPLMIAAWRAVPDEKLAEAIVRVGKNACRGKQLPIERDEERHATWLRLLRNDEHLMREALLATLVEQTAGERIAGFIDHPDPRTTNKLVELVVNASNSVDYYWGDRGRPLLVAMAKCRDPRVVAHVEAVRERWQPRRGHTKEGWERKKQIDKLLAAVVAAFPLPHPELSAADREMVAAIVDKLGGDVDPRDAAEGAATDASLRAAVYANPEADGPRAVYADWLQERGDVRGEMIALQLARKPGESGHWKSRDTQLLDQYGRQWLDALATRVHESHSVRFSRGFPSEIYVGDASPDPAWSTIEVVHRDLPASNACPMPLLRRAEEIPLHKVVALAEMTSPPPLEYLHAIETNVDGKALLTALRALRLPRLKNLELSSPAWHTEPLLRPEHLDMLRAIGPLETLAITAPLGELGAWIEAVAPTTLPTFILLSEPEYPPWRVTCTRDERGRLSRLAAKSLNDRFACEARVRTLATMMTAMPEGSLTSIAMEVNHTAWRTVAERRMIAAALDRHPGIDASGLKYFTRPTR